MKTPIRTLFTLLLAGALGTVLTIGAQAETIHFDDLAASTGMGQIPNGYAGLNWSNLYVINSSWANATMGPGNGFSDGVFSPPNVAFNGAGRAASVTALSGQTFNFNSGYFNAAYLNNLPVTATGSLNGTQKYSTTFTVGQAGPPTLQKFDWLGIDEVDFATSNWFTMDDLIFTGVGSHGLPASEVPEPSTWLFFLGGLPLVWFKRKALGIA